MPSLNEFHDKWSRRGVKLLSLSSEGRGVVQRFAEEAKIRYPVGIDKGGTTSRAYGVSGIPDAVVIDADGCVVWRGHPAEHGALEQAVERALEDAMFVALPENLSKKLQKPADLIGDGKLGAAHKELAALVQSADRDAAEQAAALRSELEALAGRQHKRIDALLEDQAFHRARQRAERGSETFHGSELQAAFAATVERVNAIPEAKGDLAAGALLEQALRKTPDQARRNKLLRSLHQRHPDTYSGRRAQQILQGG